MYHVVVRVDPMQVMKAKPGLLFFCGIDLSVGGLFVCIALCLDLLFVGLRLSHVCILGGFMFLLVRLGLLALLVAVGDRGVSPLLLVRVPWEKGHPQDRGRRVPDRTGPDGVVAAGLGEPGSGGIPRRPSGENRPRG